MTTEKEEAERKVTELTTALELIETELARVISKSESTVIHLTEERDKAMVNDRDTAAVAKVVGEECFDNAIEKIRFLNFSLQIKT